jgi:hypothetical protein
MAALMAAWKAQRLAESWADGLDPTWAATTVLWRVACLAGQTAVSWAERWAEY